MNIVRNLLFLLLFAGFIGVLFFLAGTLLIVGLLMLPIVLLGGMRVRKAKSQEPAKEKTLDAEFTRVE